MGSSRCRMKVVLENGALWIGVLFFFFKQKTAYEMRISDWSSDVCSSDLSDIDPEAGTVTCSVHGPGARLRIRSGNRGRYECARCSRSKMPRKIGRASCRERVCQYV